MRNFVKRAGGSQDGITLTELMVVMAVIAILVMVTAPGISDYRNTLDANEAVNMITADLQLARTQAIFRNREFRVEFRQPESNQYQVKSRPAGDATAWDALIANKTETLPSRVIFADPSAVGVATGPDSFAVVSDGVTFINNSVVFKATGAASETGAVYLIPEKDVENNKADRLKAVTVQFETTSKIKSYKYKNDAWEDY